MANVDIDPPEEWVNNSVFKRLLANTAISAAFKAQEDKANPAKRRYTQLGQLGLLAAFITFTAVIYSVTLEPWLFPLPKIAPPYEWELKVALGFIGIAGVAAQVFLLRGPLKETWLNARFRAERLRSIKFQAFQEAALGGDAASATFTARALGDLAVEFADETAARHNFRPTAGLVAVAPKTVTLSDDELQDLKRAYEKLRIERQCAFALKEIKAINEDRKLPAASSEISFWLGAALAYLDAVLALLNVEATWLRPVLHFLTLELFVLSALLFVLERGRNFSLALERYEDYREQMVLMSKQLSMAENVEDFILCVSETERQALRELKTFCREAEKSTYLI